MGCRLPPARRRSTDIGRREDFPAASSDTFVWRSCYLAAMPHRPDEEDGTGGRLWRQATGDAEPLPERPRRIDPRRRRSVPATTARATVLHVESYGEHVDGWSGAAGEEALRRIHRGEWPAQLRLDLHGDDAEEARRRLRSALRAARRAGLSGVLVVHGRGVGSVDGPVLKRSLPGWLAEPPHGTRVLAFSTAGPHGGRGGAMLVALRR
jgi:DNA-nicking Smr family endonuclease